jgi:hypothetical protein
VDKFFYRAFGLVIASDTRLPSFETSDVRSQPDLTLRFSSQPLPLPAGCVGHVPGLLKDGSGRPWFSVSSGPSWLSLHVRDCGRFDLDAASTITVSPVAGGSIADERLEMLLPTAIALWLERAGIPVLHASAVVMAGHVVLFVADTGAGKSSVASALVQAGGQFFSDDLVPLIFRDGAWYGAGGPPFFRLTPESASRLRAEDIVALEPDRHTGKHVVWEREGARVHTAPVGIIYLYSRRPSGPEPDEPASSPAPPVDALIELVRHSYLGVFAGPVSRFQRLARLAELVSRVPVRRLSVPNGFDNLARVAPLAFRDLDAVGRGQ